MFRLLGSHLQAIHELCSRSTTSTDEILAHYGIPYGFISTTNVKPMGSHDLIVNFKG
jgi:hypothetical protein